MLHFYERINDDDDDEMNVIYLNADPMHYLTRLAKSCVLPLSLSDDLAYTGVLYRP